MEQKLNTAVQAKNDEDKECKVSSCENPKTTKNLSMAEDSEAGNEKIEYTVIVFWMTTRTSSSDFKKRGWQDNKKSVGTN